MAKGVNIVSCKAFLYHYLTFDLAAFIDILLITVHSQWNGTYKAVSGSKFGS